MRFVPLAATLFLLAAIWPKLVYAQSGAAPKASIAAHPGTAEGQLTVTLTIVPSVGIVMDENGQPRVIVANAADPADNVSRLNVVEENTDTQHSARARHTLRHGYGLAPQLRDESKARQGP